MKILVAIKQVLDYQTTIRIRKDKLGVEKEHVKMIMNPFDAIAMEEAIRLKEKGLATEIIAISIGRDSAQEVLRTALAIGADRAILIKSEDELQSLAVAKVLKEIVQQEMPTLVILGKQAIDTDNNQVGQMLAGLLNWAQGTFASSLSFNDKGVSVTREIDGGLLTVFLKLPAVITTDLRLNEPRYISLLNIVQAKHKTLTILPIENLEVDIAPRIRLHDVSISEKHRSGIRVASAAELVQKLKFDAQVI